jgi:uncharacterized protein YndB with AHSA1/START domain
MNEAAAELRTVTVEREIGYPPEKIWRALTTPHLLQEWLMQSDFVLEKDHDFTFRGDWGSVDCRVLEVEPPHSLSYTWGAMGLESVVSWTLTPTPGGTHLRLDQTGFRKDQEQAYQGAKFGWKRMIATLEEIVAREENVA